MSSATAERLIKSERTINRKGITTTKAGSLLKKQIPIRTFSDWNDVVPGFVEADLVAHCGDKVTGTFLNTLTLTDIASCWTECIPLLRKSESDVQSALENIRSLLPFPLLGLDTDNGSEFINHELLRFCENEKITFTRARAYRKNDQAHVEERNGSIVRRMTGFDRFEGLAAWRSMAALYAKVRLYVNYFQPSQKLLQKRRQGSKTIKQYDTAKTPCQRLIDSSHTSPEAKTRLQLTFEELDPVKLLQQIQTLQKNLCSHAWRTPEAVSAPDLVADSIAKIFELQQPTSVSERVDLSKRKKPRKPMPPRKRRTRKDPFEEVSESIELQLKLSPTKTAIDLLKELIKVEPTKYHLGQRRTLQRRVANWRAKQLAMEASHHQMTLDSATTIKLFTEIAALA